MSAPMAGLRPACPPQGSGKVARQHLPERPRRLHAIGACLAGLGLALVAAQARAQTAGPNNAITDVPGIRVGHSTLADSGVTVVLAAGPNGAGVAGGVTQRGGAPTTRETDLMRPDNMVEAMNAVLLGGGGAYGLAAASGVMRCLEERATGFPVGGGNVVPIVQAALTGDRASCGAPPRSRPDLASGLQACQAATDGAVAQGNVGAGTGAVTGSAAGAVKGGVGTASLVLPNGVVVGALVVLNSEGTPWDAEGNVPAGVLGLGGEFRALTRGAALRPANPASVAAGPLRTGTLAVVATNVALTKSQATRVAEMADDGVARAVSPAHTSGDGDTLFVLGTARLALATLGETNAALTQIGAASANVVSRAIVQALLAARSTSCIPSYCDAFRGGCRSGRF